MAKENEDKKKKKNKIKAKDIIKKAAIWLMLIAMVGSLFAYAFYALGN